MLGIALVVAIVSLAAIGGASALLTQRWWTDAPALAGIYGVVGLGMVAQLVWVAFWIRPVLGIAVSWLVVATAVVIVLRARFWTSWRAWLPLSVLLGGILAAVLGLEFLYGGASQTFSTIAARFRYLPPDNALQHMFAEDLWSGQNTVGFFGAWTGSDRPPLQSGALLINRSLGLLWGVPRGAGEWTTKVAPVGLAASIAMQMVVCVVLYGFLRTLRFSRYTTHLTILFCGVTPVFFENLAYTWPKMLSAGFALGSVTLLLQMILEQRRLDTGRFVVALVAATLAYLSHGAVAFSAPMFLIFGVAALRLAPRRRALLTLAGSAAVALVVYLPWQLYGTYRDPFTGRLLKWYFAGVQVPTPEGSMHLIARQYDAASWLQVIGARWHNLGHVLNMDPRPHLAFGPHWVAGLRDQDYFDLSWALQWGTVLVIALAVQLLRRRRQGPLDDAGAGPPARTVGLLLVASLASILLWVLTLFSGGDAIVHQGSYAWVVVLLAVPFAWFSRRRPGLGEVLIAVSLGYVGLAYTQRGPTITAPVSPAGLTLGFLGTLVVITSFAVLRSAELAPRARVALVKPRPADRTPVPGLARTPVARHVAGRVEPRSGSVQTASSYLD